MDDLLDEFLVETRESLDAVDVQLVRFEREPSNADVLLGIFRLVHTIKGTCGFLGLPRLEALTHAAETVMGQMRDGEVVPTTAAVGAILAAVDRVKAILAALEATAAEPEGDDGDLIARLEACGADGIAPDVAPALARADSDDFSLAVLAEPARAAGIRVGVETLERLLGMVSELVLTRNQLMEIARRGGDHAFGAPLQRLSQVTSALQDCVMQARMQPIGHAWRKLPRLVRDLALDLGKDIALSLSGIETELDRQVLDQIKDPLTHMVRNACDHGIESPAERLAAGKPARGRIELAARQAGGSIVIEIGDDGRGLDPARLRRKAREARIMSDAELDRLSDQQAVRLIFQPGFSTADAVTPISGRGIGLDVVAASIEAMGGAIEVVGRPGAGATFTIRLPLTLAIVPALLVSHLGQRFAIPQMAVSELVRLGGAAPARVERIEAARMLVLRDQLLPLVGLDRLMGAEEADAELSGIAVVLGNGAGRFAIAVDTVLNTEEIVVKPMAEALRHLTLYAGNTIMGDGAVVLILDPNGLARAVGIGEDAGRAAGPTRPEHAEEAAATTSLLIFRSGGRARAVPVSAVSRIEDVMTSAIEYPGGRAVIQHQGGLMPLVETGQPGTSAECRSCIVIAHGERRVGLLVDEIVDVVEERLDLDTAMARPGIMGAAILRGATHEIVDVAGLLEGFQSRAPRVVESGPGPRLLLVEDSSFFRDQLVPVLRAAGFQVEVAASREGALARLGARRDWDAVVVDRDLPDLALGELMAAAASNAHSPRLVVLRGSSGGSEAHPGGTHVSKFDREALMAALRERPRHDLAEAA